MHSNILLVVKLECIEPFVECMLQHKFMAAGSVGNEVFPLLYRALTHTFRLHHFPILAGTESRKIGAITSVIVASILMST